MIDPDTRISRRTPWGVVGLAVALAALLLLLFLGSRVVARDAFAFDSAILLALRQADDLGVPIGSARFASAVRDVTALGSTTVLTMVVLFAVAMLCAARRWRSALLVAIGTGLGTASNVALKTLVARARPDLVPHLVDETSNSFPSGHAANSAIVYLTLAVLVWPMLHAKTARATMVAGAALLVAAIGTSRLYLGVHWPSDVLAGWLFGTLWAIAWWRIAVRVLRGR